MGVRLVDESFTDEAEQARAVLASVAPPPPEPPREVPAPPRVRPPTRAPELVEAMGVLARILGFRMQLLLAFLGAAVIGGYAVQRAEPIALVAATLYFVLVFLPVLFVAYKRG